jgi:hypothetical protein
MASWTDEQLCSELAAGCGWVAGSRLWLGCWRCNPTREKRAPPPPPTPAASACNTLASAFLSSDIKRRRNFTAARPWNGQSQREANLARSQLLVHARAICSVGSTYPPVNVRVSPAPIGGLRAEERMPGGCREAPVCMCTNGWKRMQQYQQRLAQQDQPPSPQRRKWVWDGGEREVGRTRVNRWSGRCGQVVVGGAACCLLLLLLPSAPPPSTTPPPPMANHTPGFGRDLI